MIPKNMQIEATYDGRNWTVIARCMGTSTKASACDLSLASDYAIEEWWQVIEALPKGVSCLSRNGSKKKLEACLKNAKIA